MKNENEIFFRRNENNKTFYDFRSVYDGRLVVHLFPVLDLENQSMYRVTWLKITATSSSSKPPNPTPPHELKMANVEVE